MEYMASLEASDRVLCVEGPLPRPLGPGDVVTVTGIYARHPISGVSTGMLHQFMVTEHVDETACGDMLHVIAIMPQLPEQPADGAEVRVL